MSSNHIDVQPLSTHIGALLQGVDLSQFLDDQTVDESRGALLEHLVIVFEDQDITVDQYLAFAKRFGEIEEPHPVFGEHNKDARVSIIESRGGPDDDDHERHTDVTYQQAPTMGGYRSDKRPFPRFD